MCFGFLYGQITPSKNLKALNGEKLKRFSWATSTRKKQHHMPCETSTAFVQKIDTDFSDQVQAKKQANMTQPMFNNNEFDTDKMDEILNADGLDWTFNEPPKGTNYTKIYIIEKQEESESESESEDEEDEDVAFNCHKCSDPVIRDSEEHDNSGCDNDENWFCHKCLSGALARQEEDESEEEMCCDVCGGDKQVGYVDDPKSSIPFKVCEDCDVDGSNYNGWKEDEDKCPACGKFMDNFDEDQCEAGCPLYDRGWEDRDKEDE